jgi:hypothetical protein
VANKIDQIEEKDIEKIIYFSDEVQPFAFISKLRDHNKSLLEDINLAKEN